jgi:hypothetical protein
MDRGKRIDEDIHEEPVLSSSRLLASLTERARDQAMERYRIIRPVLDEGTPLAQIAKRHRETPRTLRP